MSADVDIVECHCIMLLWYEDIENILSGHSNHCCSSPEKSLERVSLCASSTHMCESLPAFPIRRKKSHFFLHHLDEFHKGIYCVSSALFFGSIFGHFPFSASARPG